jgi:hypothetical protein
MSRWNIRRIFIYSYDGRRKDIDLMPSAVNIICGGSRRGKSSIAEVIDYVMGSKDCHIPGRVRNAASWVGILWEREATQCLQCRRMPLGNQTASKDYYIDSGTTVRIPDAASNLTVRTYAHVARNRSPALHRRRTASRMISNLVFCQDTPVRRRTTSNRTNVRRENRM